MRIAVVGAQGQLGAAVVRDLSQGHEVVALTHAALDVTDAAAVDAVLHGLRPDAVINCSAYNDVDGAESHPVDALNLNAFAVHALARAATDIGARLVHYSTDFVFDGTASTPYAEDDACAPRSVYASSKLLGEWFALDAPRAVVLRVESLFGRVSGSRPAKGSVAGLLKGMLAGQEVRVFEDRVVTPGYVVDLARATRQILEREIAPGIYHCVNSGSCTWLGFAQELARQVGVTPRLQPVRFADVKLPASRPLYCALSNAKLAAAGIVMPSWQDALQRSLRDASDDVGHQPADRQA